MEHVIASLSPVQFSSEDWFDLLEEAVPFQVRAFIEAMVEAHDGNGRRRHRSAQSGQSHRTRTSLLLRSRVPRMSSILR